MMMKLIRNEKGIALVMVMIIALIGLAMVSSLLFMVTQGTRISGFQRVYRTTDEAGLGGAQIATQFIMDNVFTATQAGNSLVPIAALLNFSLDSGDNCLKEKLTRSRGEWDISDPKNMWPSCKTDPNRAMIIDADKSPDFTFDVAGANQTFRVYTKIIDTAKGNTAGGIGGKLGGSGVVSSQEGQITPPPNPTLYRIEVQAQDASNPDTRSKYSVLYGY